MADTIKKQKTVTVIKTDDFLEKYFDIAVGDSYQVKNEGKMESLKHGYRVDTKNGRTVILYDNEVEVGVDITELTN